MKTVTKAKPAKPWKRVNRPSFNSLFLHTLSLHDLDSSRSSTTVVESHTDGESLSQWLSAFRATREARAYAVATATRTPYIVQWNSAYSGWLSHPVLHEFYTRTCAFDWQFRCALWIKKIVTLALPARPWKIAPTLLFLFGLSMGYRYLFSMAIAIAIEKIRKCFRK